MSDKQERFILTEKVSHTFSDGKTSVRESPASSKTLAGKMILWSLMACFVLIVVCLMLLVRFTFGWSGLPVVTVKLASVEPVKTTLVWATEIVKLIVIATVGYEFGNNSSKHE